MDNIYGKVYIAGAGCGDYELMTLKLERVVKSVDCIVFDRLINKNILNLAKEGTELIYLGKENTEGGLIQDKINETLVQKAKEGKDVLRLKGGHPFVFGRGGEEILSLVEEEIEFEVIPGITSAISVPAYAGIPISHRGINTSFHIFTGHTKKDGKGLDFETIAKLDGTLVFLMGVKNLPKISKGLISNGKLAETPVALIEKGSTPLQRTTIGTLENISEVAEKEGVVPPAIILVGGVAGLREQMQWFEKKPFFGKRVLVTRNREQAKPFSNKVREMGGDAVELPFIDIEYLNFKMPDLEKFKVLLFNSPNAVRAFFNQLDDMRKLGNIKVGAVGSRTVEELKNLKITPDFVPEKYLGELLAKESMKFSSKNDNILLVTSDISPIDVKAFSDRYNRNFEKLTAYKTIKIKREEQEVAEYLNEVDILTFLSGSTFEAFINSINERIHVLGDKKIISIGPKTTEIIEKYGVKVDIEAEDYSVDGVIEAIKGI